ncbi:MAG: CerR family C-terminal domain-containing protein [Planctomycetales bacterium]|nr:CerR family C-terminal domain-containing protein [Planctomycetales bacterium]
MNQPDARQQILQAAGPIFAEQGFKDATVREICKAAGVNVAAINYYFGDKRRLYVEAVSHAYANRLGEVPVPNWSSETSPSEKLRGFILAMVRRMVGMDEAPWEIRLLTREVLQPSDACRKLAEDYFRPQFELLLSILDELVAPATSLTKRRQLAFSIIGQCVYYRVANPIITHLVPDDALASGFGVDALANHIGSFSLAAIQSKTVPERELGSAKVRTDFGVDVRS